MTWIDVLQPMADYTKNSGFDVTINKTLPTVSIDNPATNEGMFLQGQTAEQYIDEVDALWEKAQDVNYDTVKLALAGQYIDNLN